MTNFLLNYYHNTIVEHFQHVFPNTNIHTIPKLLKINLNMGLGLNAQNPLFLKNAIHELRLIACQQPVVTIAKQSISGFKIRKNIKLGLKITLRRHKMYAFLYKLTNLVLPRLRDFQGLNLHGFDNTANYHFGIHDQLVFPELDYDKVECRRGFNLTFITSTVNQTYSQFLLTELGLRFTNSIITAF